MTTQALKAVATGIPTERPRDLNGLSKFLAGQMKQIKSVIASIVTPEKMARIALNELRNNDYLLKIAIQNPESFVNAVVQASHLGLEIGGSLGQAYLVPFKGEVKMMPGYRGLISLARRSGEISSINAEIVYTGDEFDLELGLETKVKHKPRLSGSRGDPYLAYMVAHFKDGGSHFEWMTIEEIMSIKARSSAVQSGKKTPWDTDRDEMIRKTVIRRGWKYLPMSIEMQNASAIETANDQGNSVVIEGDSVVVSQTTESIDRDTGEIYQNDPEDAALKQVEQKQTTRVPPVQTTQAEKVPAAGEWQPSPEEMAAIHAQEMAEASARRVSAANAGQ